MTLFRAVTYDLFTVLKDHFDSCEENGQKWVKKRDRGTNEEVSAVIKVEDNSGLDLGLAVEVRKSREIYTNYILEMDPREHLMVWI